MAYILEISTSFCVAVTVVSIVNFPCSIASKAKYMVITLAILAGFHAKSGCCDQRISPESASTTMAALGMPSAFRVVPIFLAIAVISSSA